MSALLRECRMLWMMVELDEWSFWPLAPLALAKQLPEFTIIQRWLIDRSMAQDATTLSKRVRAVRSHSSFKFCAASISVVHTFQFALPPLVIWCLVWFGVCVSSRVLRLRSWRDFWRPHSLFQHSVQYRHHWACPMCLYGTLCWPGGGGVSWWFGGSCHSFKCWDHSWWAFGCLGCQSWNNSIFWFQNSCTPDWWRSFGLTL